MCKALSMSRVIDVTLLRVSGSKRHRGGNHESLFHPQLLKMTTTHQRSMNFYFFFREIMYLSQCRGSWVCFTPPQVAISSECAVKVSRLDAPYEPSLDRTFHHCSFTILRDFPLHKHMHMMAFATFAGCPRCPARRAGTAVYFVFHTHTTYITLVFLILIGSPKAITWGCPDHFVPQVSNLLVTAQL